jgi:hypothetical protein
MQSVRVNGLCVNFDKDKWLERYIRYFEQEILFFHPEPIARYFLQQAVDAYSGFRRTPSGLNRRRAWSGIQSCAASMTREGAGL